MDINQSFFLRIKSVKHIFFLVVALTISGHVQANTQLYVVKEKDTLTGILRALNYGETYAELVPFIDEIVGGDYTTRQYSNFDGPRVRVFYQRIQLRGTKVSGGKFTWFTGGLVS